MFGKSKSTTNDDLVPVRTTPTGLTVNSPRTEIARIQDQMDHLMNRVFGYSPSAFPFLRNGFAGDLLEFAPPVDLYETDSTIKLFAELPGYKPDQVTVETTGDTFTITGEKKALYEDGNASARQRGGVASAGRFRLTGSLPGEIDPKQAKATFANGVLELEMPKTEQARAQTVKIPISG